VLGGWKPLDCIVAWAAVEMRARARGAGEGGLRQMLLAPSSAALWVLAGQSVAHGKFLCRGAETPLPGLGCLASLARLALEAPHQMDSEIM